MKIFTLIFLFFSLNSFGQQPLLVVTEEPYNKVINPAIVLYTDGTIIKNTNETGEPEYVKALLDSSAFENFLNSLNIGQLRIKDTTYHCEMRPHHHSHYNFFYFGNDTLKIEVIGELRQNAWLLKNYPNSELNPCIPKDFSKSLSNLLYTEVVGETWQPEYFYAYNNETWTRFRGSRLNWFKNEMEGEIRYELPSEEVWIKQVSNNR